MQVDPSKPKLKPPGTKRLKLEYDKLHSIFAFKFHLRRHKEEEEARGVVASAIAVLRNVMEGAERGHVVGQCRLTLSNPH